ncbi:MAG: radical SAM protein [Thermoplasmata archaeon]
MEFYYPGKQFPALSVTGHKCMLNCAHCRGHYLRGMKDVSDPDRLYRLALKLFHDGASGFLLSGGSDEKGRVPLDSHMEVIKKIRRETSLTVNLHTGIVDPGTVGGLKQASPQVISLDMVGSQETIREVYGLDIPLEDYENSYNILRDAHLNVVPHVTVGLNGGKIKGEFRAVDIVSDTKLLILNSLIPSYIGKSVSQDDFIRVLKYARDTTDARIYLGCMRERGRVSLEKKALEKGASGIVIPARDTLKWAEEKYPVRLIYSCCAAYR